MHGVSFPNMWEYMIANSVAMNHVSSLMKMLPKHQDNQSAKGSSHLLCALYNQYANQVLISQSSATQRKRINTGRRNTAWVFTGWTTQLWFTLTMAEKRETEQWLVAACIHRNLQTARRRNNWDMLKHCCGVHLPAQWRQRNSSRTNPQRRGHSHLTQNYRYWAKSPAADS